MAKRGISAAEAARQIGVSAQTVYDWGRKGWLVRYPDRSVDLPSTLARVDSMRDPTRGGLPDRGVGAPQPLYAEKVEPTPPPAGQNPGEVPGGEGETEPIPVTDATMTLAEARRRKEYWQSVRAEMEARKLQGEFIPLDEAQREYVASITTAKAALEAVPQRVAPRIVGLTAIQDVRAIVAQEIEAALRTVSADQST